MSNQKAFSISMAKSGKKTSIPHNNRDMDEKEWERNDHIDKSKMDENIILKQDDIEDLYEHEFGESLENYNAKQRRKDRKIDSYYEHVKDSKKTHEQQEMIIQVGDMDDIQLGDLDPNEAKEILLEWYEDFEERNPNLKVYNAVIHMDEATPHLHLNFVPVATGYKRGLEKQVSFDKALTQQDNELDKKRPFKEWRDKEVGLIAEAMKKRGIDRKLVGTHEGMTVDRYKEVKERERNVSNTEKSLKNKVESLSESIQVKNEQFRNKAAVLKQKEQELKEREQKQAQKDVRLTEKERELKSKAEILGKRETALNTSKSDFERYSRQKEQEFKEREQKQAQKDVRLTEKERELKSKAETLGKRETTLNTSESDFEEYSKQREQEIKEKDLKTNMRATQLTVRERALKGKESEFNKSKDEFNESMQKKEQEIERKTEEMKAERLRLAELMKKAHTWTTGKLESMKSHLQKRRQQIELTDDDLNDLNQSDNKLQR